MKLYLSSYKLGTKTQELKDWLKEHGSEIAIIANSRDGIPDTKEKEESLKRNILELEEIGFTVNELDLKDYFYQEDKLKEALKDCHAVYVIGGNTFSLRLAMKYSGFDNYLKEQLDNDNFLYAGYSAGICVLAPTLIGLDIVDKPINPYDEKPVIYEGLQILDYIPVPHYKSNHPESKLVDEVVSLFDKMKVNYKTLKDGEVIIENFSTKKVKK